MPEVLSLEALILKKAPFLDYSVVILANVYICKSIIRYWRKLLFDLYG